MVLHGDDDMVHRHAELRAVIVMMRRFAWCGTSQSTSAVARPARSSAAAPVWASLTTACLKTSWPAILTTPAVPVVEGPPST